MMVWSVEMGGGITMRIPYGYPAPQVSRRLQYITVGYNALVIVEK